MTIVSIVRVHDLIVGALSANPEGRGLVFQTLHNAFGPVDGSRFASQDAAQRAVNKIAYLEGFTAGLEGSGFDDEENEERALQAAASAMERRAGQRGRANRRPWSRAEEDEARAIRNAMI